MPTQPAPPAPLRALLLSTLLTVALALLLPLAAAERALYLYGDVAADGTVPSGEQPPFHQMRLSDTGNLGMSQFREAIIEAGLVIEERYDDATTLDAGLLADFQVLILASNQRVFSTAEATAVEDWVQAGGGLIAYSDSAFGGDYRQVGVGNTRGRDSDNSITTRFGMFFMRDNGAGNYLVEDYEAEHFINGFTLSGGLGYRGEGVSPIRVSAPATMLARLQNGGLNGAIRLHKDDPPFDAATDAALAIASIGAGRVLGTFDRNTFWNAGAGTRLSQADNRLFAQRIVLWAAGLDGGNASPVITTPAAADPAPVTGTGTSLSVAATDPDDDPVSFEWVVSQGPDPAPTLATADQATTEVTFLTDGSYTFEVTVSDGEASVTSSVQVTVEQVASSIDLLVD